MTLPLVFHALRRGLPLWALVLAALACSTSDFLPPPTPTPAPR